MTTAKQVINSTKPKYIKPAPKTQLGSVGYDNEREDIEKVKKLREGSVVRTPTDQYDITNKAYVDALTTDHPHQDVTTAGQPNFLNFGVGTFAEGDTRIWSMGGAGKTPFKMGTTLGLGANPTMASFWYSTNVLLGQMYGTATGGNSFGFIAGTNVKYALAADNNYADPEGTIDLSRTLLWKGAMKIGDKGVANYVDISTTGDVSFVGSSGFYPRTLTQDGEPVAGTGATQIDSGEQLIWIDTNDANRSYMMYNYGGAVTKIELV